jgi:hypothetical protein
MREEVVGEEEEVAWVVASVLTKWQKLHSELRYFVIDPLGALLYMILTA